MTEQQFRALGFERVNVLTEESGDEPFYYYRYSDRDVILVSCTNFEQVKIYQQWEWFIMPIGYEIDIQFWRENDIKRFIQWMESQDQAHQEINNEPNKKNKDVKTLMRLLWSRVIQKTNSI